MNHKENEMKAIGRAVIEHADGMGADMAEAYISNNRELNIEVRDNKVETMKLADEGGLGIRVMKGNRTGFAYTSDLSEKKIAKAVEAALVNAKSTSQDPFRILPGASTAYPSLDLFDPRIGDTSVEEKIILAKNIEQSARDYDSRVKIVETSSYLEAEVETVIVNSNGLELFHHGTYCGIYIALVAVQDDDSQTGFAINYGLKYSELNPYQTGQEAAERAVRMLGARTISSQKIAVLLEPYVATGFLELIAPSLTAEAVQKGRSLFIGKTGQDIAAKKINIIDDGKLPGGIASSPFDGEGVATGRTELVTDGVLKGFLYNSYTGLKDGVKSTGNGVRSSFKSTPEVGITNLFIEKGERDPKQIIAGIKKGLYITEVLGMHTANPISGDFSLGVSGLMIENGEITYPVRGVALAGNIIDMMKNVKDIGNDLTFFGGMGAPTILIDEMMISGN
ncbi:MAG: TldD/PmbA family protein [Peptococcaceae bacterium]|nr:TldD/PmbA family protein [Peptococcaceae bacterium]